MTEYISQNKFAIMCGVSRQAVHKAIKEGRVVKTSRGIDPDNPSNQYFCSKAGVRKTLRKRPTKKGAVTTVKVPVIMGAPPETPEDTLVIEGGPRPKAPKGAQVADFDVYQKAYEETRLKKIQADMAVLKYAKDVGAVVDIETLKQKMGAFTGFLFSRLVYLPEGISADLWMTARSNPDPERKIREMLSGHIEEVIQEAKVAALAVLPAQTDVRYVMLGLDDE